MRLKSFYVRNVDQIANLTVDGLSDVVVIAGPNGVGKTKAIQSLVAFFRNLRPGEHYGVIVEATSEWERHTWGKSQLDTANNDDTSKLQNTLQRNQRRNNYKSTVLNFESDRTVRQVRPFVFSWDIVDPYEEDVGWDLSYGYLRDRFQDVQDTLFKRIETRNRAISQNAIKLKSEGASTMPLDFPDPL